MDTFRGHDIHKEDGEWLFSDTNDPVSATWKVRPCGHCNIANTQGGYDGCIGRLPGVMNACCGHGEPESAFIQFNTGLILRGPVARRLGLAMRGVSDGMRQRLGWSLSSAPAVSCGSPAERAPAHVIVVEVFGDVRLSTQLI